MLKVHPDAHLKLRGKLQIGITTFPRKPVWITEWADPDDLRNTLHASFHIPVYCREVPSLAGQPVVDGGISIGAKHLAHGDRTLAISPAIWTAFPGESTYDISVPLWPSQCLLPPAGEAGSANLFRLGEQATNEWLLTS